MQAGGLSQPDNAGYTGVGHDEKLLHHSEVYPSIFERALWYYMFLSELSYKFITDFEFYLRNYKPKDHQKPLGNNGVMKHLERFVM